MGGNTTVGRVIAVHIGEIIVPRKMKGIRMKQPLETIWMVVMKTVFNFFEGQHELDN